MTRNSHGASASRGPRSARSRYLGGGIVAALSAAIAPAGATPRSPTPVVSSATPQGPSLGTAQSPGLIPVVLAKKDCMLCEPPILAESVKQQLAAKDAVGTYKICIASGGQVHSTEPIEGVAAADDAVLAQVKTWRYKPRKEPACFLQSFVLGVRSDADSSPTGSAAAGSVNPSLEKIFQRATEQCFTDRKEEPGKAFLSCHRAAALAAAVFGEGHQYMAAALGSLVLLYEAQGLHASAAPLLSSALAIWEKIAEGDPVRATIYLRELGWGYLERSHYALAEPLLKSALRRAESVPDVDPDILSPCLRFLAGVHLKKKEYRAAEELLTRNVAIVEKKVGPDHAHLIVPLIILGGVYSDHGSLEEAERVFKRALAVADRALDPNHPLVAYSLRHLAFLYGAQGRYEQAELLYLRAVAIYDKQPGEQDLDAADALFGLGSVYANRGIYEPATRLLNRSLRIREKWLNESNPKVAECLLFLGGLYLNLGRDEVAGPHLRRALSILEKDPDRKAFYVPQLLNSLATLHLEAGRYALAELSLARAMQILEGSPTADPDLMTNVLISQAVLDLARQQISPALMRLKRAQERWESRIRQAASEPHVTALLDRSRGADEKVYRLLKDPQHRAEAASLALTVSLLRKGRAAQAAAQAGRSLLESLQNPQHRTRLETWRRLRMEREGLLLRQPSAETAPSHHLRIKSLSLSIDELERELTAGAPQVRSLQVPPWDAAIPRVARALPRASVLLEVVLVSPPHPREKMTAPGWTGSRYLAMLLFPDRRIEVADLGDAQAVDAAVAALLGKLRDPSLDPQAAARALYQQVMEPLRARLAGVRRLYLSMDGSLNLVPFSALHDGQKYLLDQYELHYLTSGLDLLREPVGRAEAPLILADPDFANSGMAADTGSAASGKGLYAQLGAMQRLPAARREAQAIGQLLPRARVRFDAAASEEGVWQATAPRVVHIATHGLFLEDGPQQTDFSLGQRGLWPLSGPKPLPAAGKAQARVGGAPDPLSRSALLLAGSAAGEPGRSSRQDGILTAEEVRSLNLWGTELVVLSACDTGRGAVRVGQGVYGLRRAFLTAGAQTLVTSLWQVADAETSELMQSYYQKLVRGRQSKVQAMQSAMRETRQRKPHPYYWAPFIVIGQDGLLSLR